MDVKEADILGNQIDSHWYYRAKAAALGKILRNHEPHSILDVGAGSGYFSRVLLQTTSETKAMCVDTAYLDAREELCANKPISFRPFIAHNDADLVLVMDVLEHVPDEIALLRPYVDSAKPGTRFVISVPAFQFLWSGHDVFLGHYRRYTISSLERALQTCGLQLVSDHYYYACVFPLAAVLRLAERAFRRKQVTPRSSLRPHATLTNNVLGGICSIERAVMKFNRFFGLTIFAVLIKP